MNICILTPGAYPVPATGGGAVEGLVEKMADNYEQGCSAYSLSVISKYESGAKALSENYHKMKFHYVKCSPISMGIYQFVKKAIRKIFGVTIIRLNPYFAKALRHIKQNNYDIVIVENAPRFVAPLKKYCKSRIVFHLHNDFSTFDGQYPERLLKDADMVITVSDYVTSTTTEAMNGKMPVVTVRNVIDVSAYKKNESVINRAYEIRQKYHFSENDTVCLYMGRLVPEKGVLQLIEAVNQIADEHVKLLVVGGSAFSDSSVTEFEKNLFATAKQAGDRIAFTGFVSPRETSAYYHAADIAVFPSQCEEAAGLVVLEAQGAGKPVIITDSGGMPEYVCSESALCVERGEDFSKRLKDAIITLHESQQLRQKMGTAGEKLAEDYDKSGYLDNIINAVVTGGNINGK